MREMSEMIKSAVFKSKWFLFFFFLMNFLLFTDYFRLLDRSKSYRADRGQRERALTSRTSRPRLGWGCRRWSSSAVWSFPPGRWHRGRWSQFCLSLVNPVHSWLKRTGLEKSGEESRYNHKNLIWQFWGFDGFSRSHCCLHCQQQLSALAKGRGNKTRCSFTDFFFFL